MQFEYEGTITFRTCFPLGTIITPSYMTMDFPRISRYIDLRFSTWSSGTRKIFYDAQANGQEAKDLLF